MSTTTSSQGVYTGKKSNRCVCNLWWSTLLVGSLSHGEVSEMGTHLIHVRDIFPEGSYSTGVKSTGGEGEGCSDKVTLGQSDRLQRDASGPHIMLDYGVPSYGCVGKLSIGVLQSLLPQKRRNILCVRCSSSFARYCLTKSCLSDSRCSKSSIYRR